MGNDQARSIECPSQQRPFPFPNRAKRLCSSRTSRAAPPGLLDCRGHGAAVLLRPVLWGVVLAQLTGLQNIVPALHQLGHLAQGLLRHAAPALLLLREGGEEAVAGRGGRKRRRGHGACGGGGCRTMDAGVCALGGGGSDQLLPRTSKQDRDWIELDTTYLNPLQIEPAAGVASKPKQTDTVTTHTHTHISDDECSPTDRAMRRPFRHPSHIQTTHPHTHCFQQHTDRPTDTAFPLPTHPRRRHRRSQFYLLKMAGPTTRSSRSPPTAPTCTRASGSRRCRAASGTPSARSRLRRCSRSTSRASTPTR